MVVDSYHYCTFGLTLQSDLPVPGLVPASAGSIVDVQIALATGSFPTHLCNLPAEPLYESPKPDEQGEPALQAWKLDNGTLFRLRYSDGTEFIIDRPGTRIWASWSDALTLEDMAVYLLGPVLGFVLRLRGMVCLHASAIAVDGKALVLLGSAGAGKSTTAAAFARLGYPVISDDVVPLQDHGASCSILPGNPQIKLWPDSTQALFGEPAALPVLTPNWDKRYLDLRQEGFQFQARPLPLAAIYSLQERCARDGPAAIIALKSSAGVIDLVAKTYVNYLLDRSQRAAEFDVLARLARQVPLRAVRPPADLARVADLCRSILRDFAACQASPALTLLP